TSTTQTTETPATTTETEAITTIATETIESETPVTTTETQVTTTETQVTTTETLTSCSTSSPTFPISTDGACGPKNGNAVCPNDDCCSVNGFCGSTKDHCGTGCQQDFGFCGIINDGLEIITTCSNKNTIAITFDDGPRQITSRLLDELAGREAKATFFINGHAEPGSCIYDFADIIQRAHTEGHLLGSHTWSHPHLAQVNESEIVYQLDQLETAFNKILGTTPKYFRPPFGEGLNDPTLRKELIKRGYKVALWDIDTRDFDEDFKTSKELFLQQFNASEKGTPHIVLNHDRVVTTSELLGLFEVEYSISQGYQVQTVADCTGDINPEDWYNGPVIFGTRDDTWKCTSDDMHLQIPSLES
ncbi:21771_t:CDS:2, partial [Dentiscutata erythropus]